MLGERSVAARVAELLDTGLTGDQIAERAGCSAAYVSQVKRKLYRQSQRPAAVAPVPRRAPEHRVVRDASVNGDPRPLVDRLGPADRLVEMDGGEILIEEGGAMALVTIREHGRRAVAVVRGDRDDLTDLIEQLTAVRDAMPATGASA